jgi:RNA polymerase sigma-70 factor (ECF subfamily)
MKDPSVDPGSGKTPEGHPSIASSLLMRLKTQDGEAWRGLVRLFGPEVHGWCRRAGLQPQEAEDVVQQVWLAVARNLGTFRRDLPGQSFRGWLWRIVENKLRDHWRGRTSQPRAVGGTSAQQRLQQTPEPEESDSSHAGPGGEAGAIYLRALNLIREEFTERTFQAFWQVAIDGRLPADVAAELGMSIGAVYVAKSKVLRRLREAFGDLMD